MREPHGTEVDAVSIFDGLVPEEGNRGAVENTDDDRFDGEHGVEGQDNAAGRLHLFGCKDADVLQQDGDLHQADSAVVEDDAHVEILMIRLTGGGGLDVRRADSTHLGEIHLLHVRHFPDVLSKSVVDL